MRFGGLWKRMSLFLYVEGTWTIRGQRVDCGRQLPKWISKISPSWHLCICVIPSPCAWVRRSDLLLTRRTLQKWWDIAYEIRLQKVCGFPLAHSFSLTLIESLVWGKPVPCVKDLLKDHMARNQWLWLLSKSTWGLSIVYEWAWKCIFFHLGLEMTSVLASTFISASWKTWALGSQLHYLDPWPTETTR